MASSSAAAADSGGDDHVQELKTKLYELCALEDRSTVFRQDDLLNLNIIEDRNIGLLLQVTQKLCDEKLFKLVRDGSAAGWMYRSEEDATIYSKLTHEQEMVYALVDGAGADGIWSKNIKTKTGLHDSAMRSAIKNLETRRLISDMKTVEHLNRKMYIKSSLSPSERATGGPWYTDGELDEEFIDTILKVLYGFIFAKSFYKSSHVGIAKKPMKSSKGSSGKGKGKEKEKADAARASEEARALRDAALSPAVKLEIEQEPPVKKQKTVRDLNRYLPLPAGYLGYPTLKELTFNVQKSNVTPTTLTKEEISQLLDVLCFDKRIEIVLGGPGGVAYKALRKSESEIEEGPSNGLTEAPCGRCPVFDLCEEGGPVGPSNCEYFNDWLRP